LDDLERRNGPNRRTFTEFGSFLGGLRKTVVEDRLIFSAAEV